MATAAGIVFIVIVAGVIVFDVFLLGRHLDRRMNNALEPERDRYNE